MATLCRTCRNEIQIVQTSQYLYGWRHVDETIQHRADPLPTCPKCGSENYTYSQQAWADVWDCGDCGHRDWFSIGD
ncbi:hypothetical protein LI90_4334 (plasmid) [Carbonactinospora thermoautotrophica]|uniref:Uncharacterized protein n=1 Tax=Carbonactinospora thermoautotrophica TaxID=1469144 RepID=A0A132MHN2_9ACTN|nr:hypothetical protein [Carbonactinospora thermoautotrophica]KWW97362.1 hypothetical protein LI90_4334 [Carbonactinospora thermoautotrophica]